MEESILTALLNYQYLNFRAKSRTVKMELMLTSMCVLQAYLFRTQVAHVQVFAYDPHFYVGVLSIKNPCVLKEITRQ